MSKFVVGQRVVGNERAASPINRWQFYTISRVETGDDNEGDRVWVERRGNGDYDFFWAYRFDAVRVPVAETEPEPKPVTLTYGILSVTIDLSKPLGRKLIEAALEVIYKDAAA